jgi:A/G-specific adenine glycosylase
MRLASRQIPAFRRALLRWYRRHRRRLPWRATRDPYEIWVAEVMLQQTRVPVVLDYYRRFLRRFPTVRALARAPAEEVLRAWAGLGYYRRARNLHRAAREIVREYSGRFPQTFEAALRLPGAGRYTARAVLSIAYGAPLAVLDGNVARVLARLDARRGPISRAALDARAQELLALKSPGDWNQAMMELGATVCTPRAPRCPACPAARWCRARALGIADSLPARPFAGGSRRPVRIRIAAAILLDPQNRTLLIRSGENVGALFSRMWHFPAVEVRDDARRELAELLSGLGIAANGLQPSRSKSSGRRAMREESAVLRPLPPARHTVTFREITLEPFLVRVERLPRRGSGRILPLARLETLAVSNATRKLAARAAPYHTIRGAGGLRPAL